MKKRIRTCRKRCHQSKGTRCACVCQGFYHSSAGAANRQALLAMTEEEAKKNLEEHGFKQGETAYLNQTELPLEVKT